MGTLTVTLTGDEARLLRSLDRVVQKERELAKRAAMAGTAGEQGATKAARGYDKLGKKARAATRDQKSLQKSAIDGFKKMAAGAISVSGAIAGITGALRGMHAERQRGAQTAKGTASSIGKLAQLAGGDKKRFQQLVKAGVSIAESGGAKSLEDAFALTFELGSAGALGEKEFFGRLSAVDDPAVVAKSTALLKKSFGKKAGSFQELVSKGIAGATPATGVDVSGFLQGASRASATAKLAGVGNVELLAAVSLLSEVTGSGEQAGTQADALIASLTKQGRLGKGQTLEDAIGGLAEGSPELAQLLESAKKGGLGRKEAVKAFGLLREGGKFAKRKAEIAEAAKTDLAGRTIGLVEDTPILAAEKAERASKLKLQLAERRNFGKAALDASRALTDVATESVDKGEAALTRQVKLAAGGAAEFLTGDATTTEVTARTAGVAFERGAGGEGVVRAIPGIGAIAGAIFDIRDSLKATKKAFTEPGDGEE